MVIPNLLQFLDFKGLSKRSFYNETGLSNGALDAKKGIGTDKLVRIAATYPELNINWVVTGLGEMLIEKEVNAIINQHIKKNKVIPFVKATAIGGFGGDSFSIGINDVKEHYVIPKFDKDKIDFMIEVEGDSMFPKYYSGDVVACTIIKETSFIQWNKIHVIATKEQGIIIKRINKGKSDEFFKMISENKDYPPFEVPVDEITGIALVIGSVSVM